MNEPTIVFQFPDLKAALNAMETFDELGYEPLQNGRFGVEIKVIREDITTALEIANAHGGNLAEHDVYETDNSLDCFSADVRI